MAKEFKEKTITINLKRAYAKPRTKRAKAALFAIKNAVKKETRGEEIAISNGVNETIWERGLFKIPRKITVKATAEKERVFVSLPNEKIERKEEKKGAKQKAEAKAKEAAKEKEEVEKKAPEKIAEKKPKTELAAKEKTAQLSSKKEIKKEALKEKEKETKKK